MSKETIFSNASLLSKVIMIFAILGIISETSGLTKHIIHIGDGPTELDASTTIDNYAIGLENSNSTLSNTSSSSLQDNNSCPEGYFMDEGICRLKPSEQPNPPMTVPLCPPGYYAQSGGICEPIPDEGNSN